MTRNQQPNHDSLTNNETPVEHLAHKILRSRLGFTKTTTDILANYLTTSFGTLWFLGLIAVFIVAWVTVNMGFFSTMVPIDPYPFIFLMMLTQFFAIFLSVIVLMSQNRQGEILEVRQQIDFEINVRAEHEITKILHMLNELCTEVGIARIDKELEQMKEKIDIAEIKKEIEVAIEEERNMK